jgi:heat shock protein HtpX
MKRILLFALMNIAVLAVIGVVMRLVGLDAIHLRNGAEISYVHLLAGSAVYGFVGSLVSLFMSKSMAKWSTGAQVITQPRSQGEAWLLATVQDLSKRAGIGMPEVAVYDSPEPNAFATGARRDSALVAVSTGLLQTMRPHEVEAVLAHEIAHVANGDMVTMALLQGVMNTFVIFFSRVIGFAADTAMGNRDRRGGIGSFAITMLMQVVLGIGASLILAWFSRRREYRADAGAAQFRGAPAMIDALRALQRDQHGGQLPRGLAAFGIRGGGVLGLFRTHPPLEDRIAALSSAR